MPIYEFKCKSCSREFRALRRTVQSDNLHCPECGNERVVRLLSVTADQRTGESEPAQGCASGGCGSNGSGCACFPN